MALHLVVHPLALLFRDSLRVLRRMPVLVLAPLGLIWLSELVAIWIPDIQKNGQGDLTINDWPRVLLPSLAEALQRMSWSFHSVSQAGILSFGCPLVLLVAGYFVMKLPNGVSLSKRSWLAVTALVIELLLSLFGVAFLVGWRDLADWQLGLINSGLSALSTAWIQIWFYRCVVEHETAEQPVMAAALETAKRWMSVSCLAILNFPLIWLEQSLLQVVQAARDWFLPELLCLWMFLPMILASRRLPFYEAGGASVILAKNILPSVLGLLISALTLFTLVTYTQAVISHGLHEEHRLTEILLKTVMQALLQSWLAVSCALLLLRSGYFRPVALCS